MFGRPQEEGDQIRVYAPFTSMPPHTILSVDWGDGSTAVQNPQIDETNQLAYATHVYATDGAYKITFSVQSLSVNPVVETTTIYLRILNAAYVIQQISRVDVGLDTELKQQFVCVCVCVCVCAQTASVPGQRRDLQQYAHG